MSAAQKIIQGEGSIQEVNAALKNAGCHSVFLVTGKHFQLSAYPALFKDLTVEHFIRSGMNVEEEEVQQAFTIFSDNTKRAIVAIGGGSVIDLAKAVIHRCIETSIEVPFFAAIPTTAGSGSEATHFAVLYREKRKYSLVHPGLLPELVILDPALTYSLSPYQTAVSGMDAFSQAVESFWNVNATAESKKIAKESMLLWKESFLTAVNQLNTESRKKMLMASHLAGKAINITRTTGPHALSYYLTINHHVPHGQAVALFLPLFFLYNKPVKELCSILGAGDELIAKEMIQQKMKLAELATNFTELGLLKDEIIDVLLDEVNEERFANNPEPFDRERLKQLMQEHL